MVDYIRLAHQAYADSQEERRRRQDAEKRAFAERRRNYQEAVIAEHGESASAGLARALGADPSAAEFRGLQWSADGVREQGPKGEMGWNKQLYTDFQGVAVCADFHTPYSDREVDFKVITHIQEAGFSPQEAHGQRFTTLAEFGEAISRLKPTTAPAPGATVMREERAAALAEGIAQGWATPETALNLPKLATQLSELTANPAEDRATVLNAARTMVEARRALSEAQERFETMVARGVRPRANVETSSAVEQPDRSESIALKEMDGALLAVEVLRAVPAGGRDRAEEALAAAAHLHRFQTRANRAALPRTPYIEHPLRNAARIQRWGVDDANVVVAALLHDVVEDCSAEAAQTVAAEYPGRDDQEKTLEWIGDRFGPEVRRVVRAVTTPPRDPDQGQQARNAQYRQHVADAVEDSGALLVKASDFADNAGSLHHHLDSVDQADFFLKQVSKYQPLIPVFHREIDQAVAEAKLSPQVGESVHSMIQDVSHHLEVVAKAAAATAEGPVRATNPNPYVGMTWHQPGTDPAVPDIARDSMATRDQLPALPSAPPPIEPANRTPRPSWDRHPLGRRNI
ncbi:hypothetical protein CGZ93_10370 [Enemella dayhoffiae]|uniref:HD domain-containing protein n=1 Tax=Enemella dayhoffiae TaxID=2016507 RepID=A0A255H4N0_9ACTN|nr:HD domain-containing protein [Enemella dayhoffiae]OYO21474.1 hypothetical protein CGZ93_10370 [Enemella dayhoffiae]